MAITGIPTPADDVINGTNGNDVIDALPGNDRVNGIGGNDRLIGNFGNDSLFGGADQDTLSGGPNNDILEGGTGNDVLNGDDGDDKLAGGAGNNRVNGGAGRDVITVLSTSPGDAGDTIDGGANPQPGFGDELQVEGGSSYFLTSNTLTTGGLVHKFSNIESVRLTGNTEDNLIDASQALVSDRVYLNGNDGKDVLKGSRGLDQLSGGRGDDRLEGNAGFNFMRGDSGNDTLIGGNDGNSMYGGIGDDLLQGGTGRNNFRETASDGAGDNRYIGGGSDDYVAIFADTNFTTAFSLFPDPNKLVLKGGAYEGANITDSVTGTDTLEGIETIDILGGSSRTSIHLFNATQNLFLNGGGGGDDIRAGSGNDFLTGSFGFSDSLSGRKGNDRLDGNGGFNTGERDRYFGDLGADKFFIGDGYRGSGEVIIRDFRTQQQDEISLRGSASDYTFVKRGGSVGVAPDTYIYFGAPANNDVVAILESANVTANTAGIKFSS